MIAPIAKEDFEDLQAAGLKPTLEDFDRLNGIALRFSCGKNTTPANFPRFAYAGNVVIYEPTWAALAWFYGVADPLKRSMEEQDLFYYFALAHGREPDTFESLMDRKSIMRAVLEWRRHVYATDSELFRAAFYAARGTDAVEFKDLRSKDQKALDERKTREIRNLEKLEDVFCQASACSGMSFSDLMRQTTTRLNRMAYEAYVQAGLQATTEDKTAIVQYNAVLEEIRERLQKEATDGR